MSPPGRPGKRCLCLGRPGQAVWCGGQTCPFETRIDSLSCSGNTVQNGSFREPSETLSPQAGLSLIWDHPAYGLRFSDIYAVPSHASCTSQRTWEPQAGLGEARAHPAALRSGLALWAVTQARGGVPQHTCVRQWKASAREAIRIFPRALQGALTSVSDKEGFFPATAASRTPLGLPSEECSAEIGRDISDFWGLIVRHEH